MSTHAATAELAKSFRPVHFECCRVHLCGGLLKKPMPVASKKIGENIVVKMNATDTWLLGAVTGHRVHGMLSRTTLLTTLHSFVEKACNGELDTRAAAEEDGDEYDPMQEIEVDDGTHPRSRGERDTSKRARYVDNKAKNRCVTVTVPAVSHEEDPTSTTTKQLSSST